MSDIVGQALAWIYAGELLAKLRVIGLRGAVEFSYFVDDLQEASKPDSVVDALQKGKSLPLLTKAAAACCKSEVEFFNMAVEIAEDPRTLFLRKTWE